MTMLGLFCCAAAGPHAIPTAKTAPNSTVPNDRRSMVSLPRCGALPSHHCADESMTAGKRQGHLFHDEAVRCQARWGRMSTMGYFYLTLGLATGIADSPR